MVGGSSKIPSVQKAISERFGLKVKVGIHPDEAITHGAALFGYFMKEQKETGRLVDVSAFPIGVGTEACFFGASKVSKKELGCNLIMCPFFSRYTPLPASIEKKLSGYESGNNEVVLDIYEGDHNCTSQNTLISSFSFRCKELDPIDNRCHLTVKISIDENSILKVIATDGNHNSFITTKAHTLSHTLPDIELIKLSNTQRDIVESK